VPTFARSQAETRAQFLRYRCAGHLLRVQADLPEGQLAESPPAPQEVEGADGGGETADPDGCAEEIDTQAAE